LPPPAVRRLEVLTDGLEAWPHAVGEDPGRSRADRA
jgi:hypothetical protein